MFVRNNLPEGLRPRFADRFARERLAWFHTSSEAEPRSSATERQYATFLEYSRSGKTVGYAEPWASAWGEHGGGLDPPVVQSGGVALFDASAQPALWDFVHRRVSRQSAFCRERPAWPGCAGVAGLRSAAGGEYGPPIGGQPLKNQSGFTGERRERREKQHFLASALSLRTPVKWVACAARSAVVRSRASALYLDHGSHG